MFSPVWIGFRLVWGLVVVGVSLLLPVPGPGKEVPPVPAFPVPVHTLLHLLTPSPPMFAFSEERSR